MKHPFVPCPTPRLRAAIFALLTGGLLLAGWVTPTRAADNKPAATASAPRPALTVSTTTVGDAQLPRRLLANGNITAWQEASVGALANGLMLREVLAQVGDNVQKDQVLARFAAESVMAELAAARAALAEAEATARDASANAARARPLQGSDALSPQQLAQFETAEQTALARVAAARAQVALQQVRLAHAEVRAPDAGIVSARMATVGTVTAPGTELFRLVRQGRLEWRAEVTAAELPQLKPGSMASVTAASGVTLKGRVRVLAPTVDPNTRNALVYVDLPPHPEVRAGMYGTGHFELGNSLGLTVPQQAVVMRDGFAYVFRVGNDQRVRQLRINAGRRSGTQVEVLSGLAAHDTVVVQGAGFLNDGDLVRVAPALAPASAPATAAAISTGGKP